MDQKKPSEALTSPRRPLRTAGLIGAAAIGIAAMSYGGIALAQNLNQPAPAEPTEAPAAEPNIDPTASFSFLTVDGLNVTVDGANSSDEDGAIVEYAWDFGDGQTGDGASATHTFGGYGTYTVTLTVTDDAGATGQFAADVTMDAPPPPPPPPSDPDEGAATTGCPSGAFIAQGGEGVELLCMWNICRALTLPDPTHPECDAAFKP